MSICDCKRAVVKFVTWVCYTRITTFFLLISWAMTNYNLVKFMPPNDILVLPLFCLLAAWQAFQ